MSALSADNIHWSVTGATTSARVAAWGHEETEVGRREEGGELAESLVSNRRPKSLGHAATFGQSMTPAEAGYS